MRWLWQAEAPSIDRYCPDLDGFKYRVWKPLQPAILALSYFGGLYFSPAAFFWLGSIRMVYALHAQCFVNSICHTQPNTPFGMDSSRNVKWLGWMHFLQGENWHRNHHARPGIARLGWNWRQPDVGYAVVCMFEKVGLVSDVRRASGVVGSPAASTIANPAGVARLASQVSQRRRPCRRRRDPSISLIGRPRFSLNNGPSPCHSRMV
jgi:hypothetical protein